MLEALTGAVRRSLHEVVRALVGEKKGAEVPPVFVLSVVLENNSRWVGDGFACRCAGAGAGDGAAG